MVAFTGISKEQLVDPHTVPEGVGGPYCISGNNRFVVVYIFTLSHRRLICLEIIGPDKHPEQWKYRDFWMSVYCFPDIKDHKQRLTIRSIGSMENEIQANFLKMSDPDKLVTAKRNIEDAIQLGIIGRLIHYSHSLAGADLEAHIAETLGVTKKGSSDPSGTVKHL